MFDGDAQKFGNDLKPIDKKSSPKEVMNGKFQGTAMVF